MYRVEIAYGMEHYQTESKDFEDYLDALEYYDDWVAKKPVLVRLSEVLEMKKYSMLD